MKEGLIKIVLKLRKRLSMVTVHGYVPRALMAFLIAEMRAHGAGAAEINRKLFEIGVYVGTRAFAELSSPGEAKMVVKRGEAGELARAMEVLGWGAWYIFAGGDARVRAEVVEGLVHGVVEPLETTFFDVEAGEANPYWLAAGAYESATVQFFRYAGILDVWTALWRPRAGGRGLEGFYIPRSMKARGLVEAVESVAPGFFEEMGIDEDERLLKAYLNVDLL